MPVNVHVSCVGGQGVGARENRGAEGVLKAGQERETCGSLKSNVSHLFAPHPQQVAMGGVNRPLTFQTREVGVIKGKKWKR